MARDDDKIVQLMAEAIASNRRLLAGLLEAEAPGAVIHNWKC